MKYTSICFVLSIIALVVIIVDVVAYIQFTAILHLTPQLHYFVAPTILGVVFGMVLIYIRNLHKKSREQEKYEYLAKKDYLTDAYNRYGARSLFDEVYAQYLSNSETFSVILFDIDKFKFVNDQYGHKEGDRILVELTNQVKTQLREQDIFARWGGEEFIVMLPNSDAKEAMGIAERIKREVETYDFKIKEQVTISIGVVSAYNNESIESLINKADDALYKAKSKGRNCIVFFDRF